MKQSERTPLSSELLRSFLVIAQTGNLTQAAARLGRTQSAISVQLRNLEESLGAALFQRSVKGMTLTHAGERLLPKAEAAVSQLQDMRRLFETPLRGQLRIGIPDDYEGRILTDALALFARTHPEVDVTAVSGCTVSYPDDIRAGRLDMAVCSGQAPVGTVLMSSEPIVWATGRAMRLYPEMPVPLAMLNRTCWWKAIPTDALRQAHRDYRVTFQTESFGSLLSALSSDFAVGVLPASCVGDDMQVLGPRHGLPPLPLIHRSILFAEDAKTGKKHAASEGAPSDVTQAMADALRANLPAP